MVLLRSSAVLLLLPLAVGLACAEENTPAEKHEYHRFHLAGFIGGTHNGEKNAFTYGGDLEYRFHQLFGVSAGFEHVNAPFRDNVWTFPFVIHPYRGIRLYLGPGFERAKESVEEPESPLAPPATVTVRNGLFRIGGAYSVHLKRGWSVGPDVAVDFVGGQAVFVYGLAIGFGFKEVE
jgi:hypothetical protein